MDDLLELIQEEEQREVEEKIALTQQDQPIAKFVTTNEINEEI